MPSRPLSPHIQIYRPQLTSMMSISHRFTGCVLYLGIVGLIIFLACLSYNFTFFKDALSYLDTPLVWLCIGLFVLSLVYHWINGLRHLIWDSGFCLGIRDVYLSGWLVLLCSVLVTLILYCVW